ncbi:15089_t:CDS:1 [Racocetra fulgida]|uniref:15089_t:CDS:1 n=1 Tax=Racocetra fulgida TaxID=60492 RepID=A0A9N9F5T3_9GLOM|nr:15089_t:CDS:1 [Racocetra fulgida]
MNTQYCSAHKSILYKLVFGQLPHCNTNLVDIIESEELLNNNTLIFEDSQSTIVTEISSETFESEFYDDIEQIQENYSNLSIDNSQKSDNLGEMHSDNNSIQNIDDDSIQEFYNDLLSLYYSEIKESSKNTLALGINEIIDSDNDLEIGCSKNSKNTITSEIIEIIDSDNDSSKTQCYTSQEKEKWQAQSEEIKVS